MSDNKDWSGVIIGAVVVGFFGLVIFASHQEDKIERIYTTLASGKFSHAEYHKSTVWKKVPHGEKDGIWFGSRFEPLNDSYTIIYLEGGASFIKDGLHDVLFTKGDQLEIKEDQFGKRKIVKV